MDSPVCVSKNFMSWMSTAKVSLSPGLTGVLALTQGHALAGLHRRGLVLVDGALGQHPVRVEGEVDHKFRAERLDQVHVADQLRADAVGASAGRCSGRRSTTTSLPA